MKMIDNTATKLSDKLIQDIEFISLPIAFKSEPVRD